MKFWVQGQSPARGRARVGDEHARPLRDDVTIAQARREGGDDLRLPGRRGRRASSRATASRHVHDGQRRGGLLDVALSSVASPVFKTGIGLSPYTKQAPELVPVPDGPGSPTSGRRRVRAARRTSAAPGTASTSATSAPPSKTCTSADVTYELAGIDGRRGVRARVPDRRPARLPDGDLTLDGVLEATGPNGAGDGARRLPRGGDDVHDHDRRGGRRPGRARREGGRRPVALAGRPRPDRARRPGA